MVTDSHHWLKVVELFPSNFLGFSIFSLEVCTQATFAGCSTCCATAIPAPTSLAISPGVSMVASCGSVGSVVPGGGLPVGRFSTYKSSSPSLGGGKGEGDPPRCPDLGGDPFPLPPMPSTASIGGSGGGLDGGTAAHLVLPVAGAGLSWTRLRSSGCVGSGGGAAGAVATLVLGGLTGLRQSCSGSGVTTLVLGDLGRGIRVAIQRISSLASRSSPSTWFIVLWWSTAQSSTLP